MEKKTKSISTILVSTILLLALAPQGRQNAQEAPLSLFLLKRPCVNTGDGNWTRRTEDISVGKAVFTSQFFMGPGNSFARMTCKLQPNDAGVNFQTLRLSFGMRDNDRGSPNVEVNIYKNGNPEKTVNLFSGQQQSVSLDVNRTENVTLEAICLDRSKYCDRVYFWEAELEYPPR